MNVDSDWAARRPASQVVHLDSAAAGQQSRASLDAVTAHARAEAEFGAYVAQRRAADALDRVHADLGSVLGLAADDVALVESATAGLEALLRAWPLRAEATVGVLPAEWGPNVEIFEWHGLRPVDLPSSPDGGLDLDALDRQLAARPPDFVHLTQVTSHRGLVQPVADAARLCRAAGVPLWVDAAQAIGHVDTASGADAVYATSRKWLTGPRGVGVLAIDSRHHDRLRVRRPALDPGLPTMAYLESREANVPGRIGLATAVREYLDDGPARIHARLSEIGRQTRELLTDLPGWTVVATAEPAGAITALRPTGGQDVTDTAARLLGEHGILTTAGEVARAPRDMDVPLLRISPHVDCTPDHLEKLRAALSGT